MKANCAILILAAGASSRLGQPKQLLLWRNTTLLGNIIQQATKSNVENVFVVLGANIGEIKSEIDLNNITIVENKNWQKGMGTSISCGVNFIQNNFPNINSILITLSDQPYITSNYFNCLIQKFNSTSKNIVATKIENRISVPAIFDTFYFEELKKLSNNLGAKNILKSKSSNVETLISNINFIDIDTIEQYKKQLKILSNK